jgi:hypothetical protein
VTTKELSNTEIERPSEGSLKKVYDVVRSLAKSRATEQGHSFMSRLKRIQIDAPEDFTANLDLEAFQSRAHESNLDFDKIVQSLRWRGKL